MANKPKKKLPIDEVKHPISWDEAKAFVAKYMTDDYAAFEAACTFLTDPVGTDGPTEVKAKAESYHRITKVYLANKKFEVDKSGLIYCWMRDTNRERIGYHTILEAVQAVAAHYELGIAVNNRADIIKVLQHPKSQQLLAELRAQEPQEPPPPQESEEDAFRAGMEAWQKRQTKQ